MIKKIINYIKDDQFKIIYLNNSVDIANYDKILEVKDDLVTLIKEDKVILIHGNNLKLDKLLDNEVLITGCILSIEL